MKITIEYESSWRNSFLDGSNNEKLPKKGRKFLASVKQLNEKNHPENFIKREITLNTIMGLMNRLIGDQRKLYQSRQDQAYYFLQIEPLVSFKDVSISTNEVTYIRNITGSNDRNSFTGMIKTNDIILKSDYSRKFWGVLALEFNDLISFIVNDNRVDTAMELDPIAICERFDEFKKIRPVENTGEVKKAIDILSARFPGNNYFNNKGEVIPSMVYCSALYLQLERLRFSERFDMDSAVTKAGGLKGISKRMFTKRISWIVSPPALKRKYGAIPI